MRAEAVKSNRTVTSLYVERWYTYILAAYVIKKDRKDDKKITKMKQVERMTRLTKQEKSCTNKTVTNISEKRLK